MDHYQELAALLLPEGLLGYFDIAHVSKEPDGKVHIFLEEKNEPSVEFKEQLLHSKGFLPEIEVQDFPVRGKKLYLHIKRRRWEVKSNGDIVSRDWRLVQSGTRMTAEFAAFLKGIFG